MSEIASKVQKIIVDKLGVEESEVVPTVEKEFGISIPDDQAEKIQTVGDAISYIESNK